jgi:hypothetical protein
VLTRQDKRRDAGTGRKGRDASRRHLADGWHWAGGCRHAAMVTDRRFAA